MRVHRPWRILEKSNWSAGGDGVGKASGLLERKLLVVGVENALGRRPRGPCGATGAESEAPAPFSSRCEALEGAYEAVRRTVAHPEELSETHVPSKSSVG